MKKIISMYVLALVLAAVGVARAEAPRSSFADFDANGDGKISKEEFQGVRGEKYQKAYDEGRRVGKVAGSVAGFSELDADANGYISKQEFSGQLSDVAGDRRERRAERRLQRGE